jgi:hypothetical protein
MIQSPCKTCEKMKYSNTPVGRKIEVDRKCIATCKKLHALQEIESVIRCYWAVAVNDSFCETRVVR